MRQRYFDGNSGKEVAPPEDSGDVLARAAHILHKIGSTLGDVARGATPHKSPGSPADQKADMKSRAEAASKTGPGKAIPRNKPPDREIYQRILTPEGDERHDGRGPSMLTGSQGSYSQQDAHKKAKAKKVKG